MIARLLTLGVWLACALLAVIAHQSIPTAAITVADQDEAIVYLAVLEARMAAIELAKTRT